MKQAILSTLSPLNKRNMSSGLAQRTLRNLDFIKSGSQSATVHAVTQVVNSLLALLVFPVEKKKEFFDRLSPTEFPKSTCPHCRLSQPDLAATCSQLQSRFKIPSLKIEKFGECSNERRFFKRLRNAVAHKNMSFGGADPDSKVLADVIVTLQDKPPRANDFDWEVSMTAEDLEKLSRFVADELIKLEP